MDPTLPARRLNLEQTAGFETAFKAFAKDCVRQTDCPLGGRGTTPEQAGRNLKALFGRLDAKPLPTGDADGRRLTESLATTGVIAAMYDEAAWQQLREALTAAMRQGDGAGLLVLSDGYYERDADGRYSNLMFANAAVNCLDLPSSFATPDEVRRSLPSFEKASPVFGESLAWAALNCAYWPVAATGEPHRIEARGAAPPSSWWARPGTRRPRTAGPSPCPASSPPAASSPTTATATPRTAGAASASTARSTRSCCAAPRRRTESGAPRGRPGRPEPGPGLGAPRSGAGTEHPGNCVDLPTLLIAPWCARRAALAQMARATHS
ncbi:hypothetical protein GCM10020295_38020 [Streptomyces cinereospinus]